VEDVRDPGFLAAAARLEATLTAFRRAHGFGRGIAAPQIGALDRFIALDLGEGPFVLVNPEITWRSRDTFTLWDDCMSFPFLRVKLRRHASISLRYQDRAGAEKAWAELAPAESELLQHELDHLDGVLAIDHALDRNALVSREVFEQDRERFLAEVDYRGSRG